MKLLLVNLDANIPKKLPLSGDTSLLLVTSGLEGKDVSAANTLFSECALKTPSIRLDYSNRVKSGITANAGLTLALNDESVSHIGYINKAEDAKKIGPMFGAIHETTMFAVGTHTEIAPITLNIQYKISADESGVPVTFKSGQKGKSEFTLTAPFVMSANAFRIMMRSIQAFNIVNDSFQRAFVEESNFPLLFAAVHLAGREVFKTKSILASI